MTDDYDIEEIKDGFMKLLFIFIFIITPIYSSATFLSEIPFLRNKDTKADNFIRKGEETVLAYNFMAEQFLIISQKLQIIQQVGVENPESKALRKEVITYAKRLYRKTARFSSRLQDQSVAKSITKHAKDNHTMIKNILNHSPNKEPL